jgi:hypothetical protein
LEFFVVVGLGFCQVFYTKVKVPQAVIVSNSYSEQEQLEQFKGAISLIKDPVSKIKIITKNTAMSDDDYKSMMKFLSKESPTFVTLTCL